MNDSRSKRMNAQREHRFCPEISILEKRANDMEGLGTK